MRSITIRLTLLGIVLALGCAGRTTETKTAHDESVEHHHGPESPKVRADDLDRELDAE